MPQGPSFDQSNAQVAQTIPQFEAWKQAVGQALIKMGMSPSFASAPVPTDTGPYALMPQGDTVTLPGSNPVLLSATDMTQDPVARAQSIKNNWDWEQAFTGKAPAATGTQQQQSIIPGSGKQQEVYKPAGGASGGGTMQAPVQSAAPANAFAQPVMPAATNPTFALPAQLQLPTIPAFNGMENITQQRGTQAAGVGQIDPIGLLLAAMRRR